MKKVTATLDRGSATWALLTTSNAFQYDVYGANWEELVAEAECIARVHGFEIVLYNPEVAETG